MKETTHLILQPRLNIAIDASISDRNSPTKNISRKIRKNRRVKKKRKISGSRSTTLKLIDFKTGSKVSYSVSLLAAWHLSKIKVASYPEGVMRHRAGMPGILIATWPSNRVWLSDISVHQRIAVSWAWIRRTFPYISGIPPIYLALQKFNIDRNVRAFSLDECHSHLTERAELKKGNLQMKHTES